MNYVTEYDAAIKQQGIFICSNEQNSKHITEWIKAEKSVYKTYLHKFETATDTHIYIAMAKILEEYIETVDNITF